VISTSVGNAVFRVSNGSGLLVSFSGAQSSTGFASGGTITDLFVITGSNVVSFGMDGSSITLRFSANGATSAFADETIVLTGGGISAATTSLFNAPSGATGTAQFGTVANLPVFS